MKRILALLTCLMMLIPGAAVASASNPTQSAYGQSGVHNVSASKPSGECTGTNGSGSGSGSTGSGSGSTGSGSSSTTGSGSQCASATETTSTGSLPFTGLDLAALAAGGIVLLGAGMVLRRVSATQR